MQADKLFQPNEGFDTPLDLLQRTIDLMNPFITDLDGQRYDIWQVLPDEDPALHKFRNLPQSALAALEELVNATHLAMKDEYQDVSLAQEAFWRFLMKQIEVRSAVVMALSAELQTQDGGDVNDALQRQSELLSKLTGLIAQFETHGWETGEMSGALNTSPEVTPIPTLSAV